MLALTLVATSGFHLPSTLYTARVAKPREVTMQESDRYQFEDPRPLLNAFFKPMPSEPSFYSGLKKGGSGETGVDMRKAPAGPPKDNDCVMLETLDAVTLAASLVDARGGLAAAEKILDEALACVRDEIEASEDGGTNEWRAYFAERPSKGPQFFDRLSDKKQSDAQKDNKNPRVYTGM